MRAQAGAAWSKAKSCRPVGVLIALTTENASGLVLLVVGEPPNYLLLRAPAARPKVKRQDMWQLHHAWSLRLD
eukprot:15684208-Heterocapsa_arctica.AAC.1